MIRKGELPLETEKLEMGSWTELKTNSNYGRITVIDEDFNYDTLFEVLESAINEYGAKFICVDYLQLISGRGALDRGGNKSELIGDVYKTMLQFLKKKKVAGIFPAQLKQTFVEDMNKRSAEELMNMEFRSGAGESYEVIKTPDLNLMLYGTPEDMRTGHLQLHSIPSRNNASFQPIDLLADAGTCTFASVRNV
jgi:hypothetical protein